MSGPSLVGHRSAVEMHGPVGQLHPLIRIGSGVLKEAVRPGSLRRGVGADLPLPARRTPSNTRSRRIELKQGRQQRDGRHRRGMDPLRATAMALS